METVYFNGWVLKVDRLATEAAYASVETPSTVECACPDCLRFEKCRKDLLHADALALFHQLGINALKEAEVMNFGPDHDGRDIWNWLYHFVGYIAATPDETRSEGSTTFTSLSDDFSIGFTSQVSLVAQPFRDCRPLVQAECFFYEGNGQKAKG